MPARMDQASTLLNAVAANGVSTAKDISDYKHVMVEVAGNAAADLLLRFQISISETAPNFGAAQSMTNRWDYVHVWDYQNAVGITGDTGLPFAAAADNRNFLINIDGIKWFSVEVSAYVAGAVTVVCRAFNNQ